MLTLAIDSTTAVCSVALAREGRLLAEISTNVARTHSQRLLPLIDILLKETGLIPLDLELLAVSRGPGSFTGLRIGIATIKGLGLALNLPVVGASSLQVLAHNLSGAGLVCPVLNARREQVYTALYRTSYPGPPELILPQQAIPIRSLMETLAQYNEPVWFCGDGVDLVIPVAQEMLTAPRLLPLHQLGNRAAALADLAQYIKPMDVDQLTPIYLRESQAEVQLRLRQEANNG